MSDFDPRHDFGKRRAPAPYAANAEACRGRRHAETESAHRSPFQRDRDRILHSRAFRRLKQKTQVFIEHEGDIYRTRLTHSLEVAQIARTISRTLGLDEDLAEAVSLAHDLGHPPFGHAGESQLDALMAPYGGFDHNGQALRIVTELERRYADFDGLNLTWETLEGLVKHNGPLISGPAPGVEKLPFGLAVFNEKFDLELHTQSGAEAQVAAVADDIAYNNHDIDDGLKAGVFTLDEVAELDIVGRPRAEVLARYPGLDAARRVFETLRRVFGIMVEDVVAESQRRLADARPRSAAELRAAPLPMIGFSEAMLREIAPLREFLFSRMYRSTRVNRITSKTKRVLRDLFGLLLAEPNLLPGEWRVDAEGLLAPAQETRRARVIADYIAGMTDRFALDEHRRLFEPLARV